MAGGQMLIPRQLWAAQIQLQLITEMNTTMPGLLEGQAVVLRKPWICFFPSSCEVASG